MNSAVLTSSGLYRYDILNVSEARAWLGRAEWESRVRYHETVTAMESVLNVQLKIDRTGVFMQPGDQALVVRLTVQINAQVFDRRKLGDPDWVRDHTELGLLRRIE